MEKTHIKGTSFQEGPGLGPWGKILKSGPLTMHFQHSGANRTEHRHHRIWLFYLATAHEYSIF